MKLLVTGASGMLGQALREVFQGDQLFGLVKTEQGKSQRSGDYTCDITNKKRVFEVCNDLRPDIVIHGAAYTDVDGCENDRERAFKVNFEGTQNLVDAVGNSQCFFIFVSTDYVFDGAKKSAYAEDDLPNPKNVYGQSKRKAEEYIQRYVEQGKETGKGARFLVVRTSWLYGKGGKNFVDKVLKLAETKDSLDIVSDQTGRPTYTVDLARALRKLVECYSERSFEFPNQSSAILHVANSGETNWADFACEIFRLAGKKTMVRRISSQQLDRPAPRPPHSVLDTSRYEKFVGSPLRSWKEAVQEYLAIRQKEKVL